MGRNARCAHSLKIIEAVSLRQRESPSRPKTWMRVGISSSRESASERPLLGELPGFDTGVCVVGGTAIGMVTRVEVPLFE